MENVRIATLDIETSPILAYCWGLFKQFIGIPQIVSDWSILSFSYKWLDSEEVFHFNTGGRGIKRVRDDKKLLLKIWKVLDEADIVVTQNGIRFDIKKINARFIENKIPPPSPFKVVDTMAEAKKIAAFTSNRLAWLAHVIADAPKDEHPEFPGFTLWTEMLADNPRAWKVCKRYNNRDVVSTEQVYLQLRPYMVGHPNIAAYNNDVSMQCPKCSSTDMARKGFAYTQSGQYQRYKCGSCLAYCRGRYTLNAPDKRRSLLTN